MADVPGAGEELQLRLPPALPVLLVFLAGPGLLRAQEDRGASEPSGAALAVDAGLRLTGLRNETATMAGGTLTLHPTGGFGFGGGGWLLLDEREIPGAVADSDLRLRVAYGGAVVRTSVLEAGAATLEGGLLLGAGTARISLAVVGTEIAADNFGVVEPHASLSVAVAGPLALRVQAGYRGVFGVEDLPRVSARHLRGWTLGFEVRLGPV